MEIYNFFCALLSTYMYINLTIFLVVLLTYLFVALDGFFAIKTRYFVELVLQDDFGLHEHNEYMYYLTCKTSFYHSKLFVCLLIFPIYTFLEFKSIIKNSRKQEC